MKLFISIIINSCHSLDVSRPRTDAITHTCSTYLLSSFYLIFIVYIYREKRNAKERVRERTRDMETEPPDKKEREIVRERERECEVEKRENNKSQR